MSKKMAKNLDSWMGLSKHDLIQSWGPPNQTTSDGSDGEILIYAKRTYMNMPNGQIDYWEYTMMYADSKGVLYHWFYKTDPNPPERIDIRLSK